MGVSIMKIRATRDSVCMGDDCNAPNERILECSPELALSSFMKIVTGYLNEVISDQIYPYDEIGRKITRVIVSEGITISSTFEYVYFDR